jgi:predicted AAA+ superfamily ATPase
VVCRLPGKRLIKRPKLYFWDTGLACHLSGLEVDLIIQDRSTRQARLVEIKTGHTAKADWATRLGKVAELLQEETD